MTRLSKRLLTSCNDAESLPASLSTSAGHALSPGKHNGKRVVDTSTLIGWAAPVSRCISDSEPSSVEGDLLPDEEALISAPIAQILDTEAGSAMRLTKWLASRVRSDPEEIFPEIAELLYGKSMAVPKNLSKLGTDNAEKPLPQLPGSNDASPATNVTQSAARRSVSDENLRLRLESVFHQGHRRGFSFLPGDDAKQPVVSSTKGSIDIETTPPPLVTLLAKSRSANQSNHSVDPSSSFAGPMQSPQREVSTGSVKTAIRGSTSRSSSESIRASCSMGPRPQGTRVLSKRSRNNPTAIAAARAASNSGFTSRSQGRTINLTGHGCYQPSGEGLQGAISDSEILLLGDESRSPSLKPGEGQK